MWILVNEHMTSLPLLFGMCVRADAVTGKHTLGNNSYTKKYYLGFNME